MFVFSWRAFNWLFRGAAEPQQLARVLALFGTLGSYAGVVALNAIALLGWAIYNQYRFRGRERRKSAPQVTSADLSELYGFPAAVIESWQKASILVANLALDGRLTGMEIRARPTPSEAAVAMPERDAPR